MKEVDYKNMEKVMMFKDSPFDPVTKQRRSKPSKMDCKIDDRYDTGLIICKDEDSGTSIWKISIATIMLIVVVVFSFSIEIEVSHLDEMPFIVFFLTYPQVLLAIIVIIMVIGIVVKKLR